MAVINSDNTNKTSRTEKKLSVLFTAAAGLLSSQPLDAANVEEVDSSLKYHHYQEDNNRMEVETTMVRVVAPLFDNTQAQFSASTEIVTGASPQYVTNRFGDPTQVISSASIHDKRDTAELTIKQFFENFNLSANLYTSKEDDYESNGFGLSIEKEFNNKNTVISLGVGDNSDRIRPTNTTIDERRYGNDFVLSWTQILTPTSLFQVAAKYRQAAGYFSDPYKFSEVFLEDIPLPVLVPDHRPDRRQSKTLALKYRKHFIDSENTLNLDYSYFTDNWDIQSHTIDMAIHIPFANNWVLKPGLRYYSQSDAKFYSDDLENPFSTHFSTDYRLASYGSINPSLKLTYKFGNESDLSVTVENYKHGNSYYLGGKGNGFDTLKATIVNAALRYRF